MNEIDFDPAPAPLLPPGFRIRRPTQSDAKAVAELMALVDLEELGKAETTLEDVLTDWQASGFDLQTDAWLVLAPDTDDGGNERVVGYEEVYNRSCHAHLDGDGYVHPQYRGLGIGTVLLRLAEARARQHIPLAAPEAKVRLLNGLDAKDRAGRRLHENEGYQAVRYFYRMQIEMDKAPPAAEWPPGILLRPFQPAMHTRPVYDALEEAFRDHWGYTPGNFGDWVKKRTEYEGFDPTLWAVAWDGDRIAGASLARMRWGAGWISQLAVRRPWRRLGLGLALLQHTFGQFYRREARQVALGVDAENPTGATRLYEKAGMRVLHEFVAYEKALRPGRD